MTVINADCIEHMNTMPPDSVDSIVTDPPYHLTSIVKRFGKEGSAPAQFGTDGAYARASKGFMGKVWDGGDIAFRTEVWEAALRVAKPGAHLLAFGGTRTFHRLAVAIEDAGWEIRDTVMYVYGSGFPKSHDVGKGIDKAAGARREVTGRYEFPDGGNRVTHRTASERVGQLHGHKHTPITAPATDAARQWDGWGTALKPAWEPIIVARKPLEGTVAANVLAHGTGALNIDGCRVGSETISTHSRGTNGAFPKRPGETSAEESGRVQDQREGLDHSERQGRWPANLIHDGSDEVLAGFPVTTSGALNAGHKRGSGVTSYDGGGGIVARDYGNDTGSAARFFYCAKASKADRDEGNRHPTVKPTALMRYLCKLVTPPAGTVLDPFMGSGSTGKAARMDGFGFIGIEQDAEYVDIARARIAHAVQNLHELGK